MNIALVAHDARKEELLDWVKFNILELSKHNLYATGTTGTLLKQLMHTVGTKLKVAFMKDKCLNDIENQLLLATENININILKSGPLGGDQEIGAMIAEGKIDCLIFFCDNLITQGHQQDVGALSRLASLYNIPFASNRTTADMLLTSSLWNNPEYTRILPDCIEKYKNRQL